MFQLLAISVLIQGVFIEINAIENATITKEIKLSSPHSITVADNLHLFTISTNMTHLQINSTNGQFKSCNIAIDPIEHLLQKKIRAKLLGAKIIVWGIRAKYENDSVTRVDYTILITDPLQCTYKAISTFEEVLVPYWPNTNNQKTTIVGHDKCSYKTSAVHNVLPRQWFNSDKHLPQVLAHDQDTFDVFYPNLTICAPCRYSIDGKRIYLDHQIKSRIDEELALFSQIEAFDSLGMQRGYFYANSFRNESAVIKLLDRDFNVVREKIMNHTVDVAAVSKNGTSTSINICYMTSRPFPYHSYIFGSNGKSANHIFCKRLNSNFESQFSTELVMPDKMEPKAITLDVDSSGNLFITVQSSNLDHDDVFIVYRLDSQGKLVNNFNLAAVKNDHFKTSNLRSFIADTHYCLEITHFSNATSIDTDWVKCIAI